MIELSRAVKSPNPAEYESSLHVHVDGSCNGMQHYAAFGRDGSGGRQVNLADSERPGDVYTAVLKLVLKENIVIHRCLNRIKVCQQSYDTSSGGGQSSPLASLQVFVHIDNF